LIVVSRLVISSEIVHSNQVPQCTSKRLGHSYLCHREGTICIDSSVGIIFFVVVANDRLSIRPPWLAEGGLTTKALGGAPDPWEGGFDGRPQVSTMAAL